MKVLGKEIPKVDGLYDLTFIAYALGLEDSQSPYTWFLGLDAYHEQCIKRVGNRVLADWDYTEWYLNWLLPDALSRDERRRQLVNGGVLETLGTKVVDGGIETFEVIWIGSVALYPKKGQYQLSRIQYGMQRKANLSVHSFAERLPGQYKPYVKVEQHKECYWGNKAAVYEYLAQGYPETLPSLVMTGKILRKAIPNELTHKMSELNLWK